MGSFDDSNDDDVKAPKRQIGLKTQNSVDSMSSTSDISRKEKFDKQADVVYAKEGEYKQRMWDNSIKFKEFVESKILSANRGPIALNLEKEVLDNLIRLALEMDDDENQPQGIGSVSMCMLLMKSVLIQRDIINELSYKMDQLDKKIKTSFINK